MMRACSGLRPGALLVSAVVLAACSSTPPKPAQRDSGNGAMACSSDTDCPSGDFCVNNICVVNSCDPTSDASMPCPDGYTCNPLTTMCEMGSGDAGMPPSDGGGCTTKYDCPSGDICLNGVCSAPGSSCATNDQCPVGQICNFNSCQAGCSSNQDCSNGEICSATTMQCGPCGTGNLCPAGQVCAGGACTQAVTCSATMPCSNGLVCTGGSCANCTVDGDCSAYGAGYTCQSNGTCSNMAATCTDAQCQQMYSNPLAYCDVTNNSCSVGQCNTSADCQSSGGTQTCVNHTCGSASTCTTAGTMTQGQPCSTMCDCVSGLQCNNGVCGSGSSCTTPGSSGQGQPCMSDCDCTTGLSCDQTTLQCMAGSTSCTTPGSGMVGSQCASNCDCSAGLTCDTTNSMTCVTPGSGMEGATCMSASDCGAGLQCINLLLGSYCAIPCGTMSDCPSQPCCKNPLGSGNFCCEGSICGLAKMITTCN